MNDQKDESVMRHAISRASIYKSPVDRLADYGNFGGIGGRNKHTQHAMWESESEQMISDPSVDTIDLRRRGESRDRDSCQKSRAKMTKYQFMGDRA